VFSSDSPGKLPKVGAIHFHWIRTDGLTSPQFRVEAGLLPLPRQWLLPHRSTGMKIAEPGMFNRTRRSEMVKLGNTSPNTLLDDLAKRELLDMLQVIIAEGGGLSAIRLVLDETKSMPEIRARFAAWQTDRRTVLAAPLVSSQTFSPSADSPKASEAAH
jgi:hypothetical protein